MSNMNRHIFCGRPSSANASSYLSGIPSLRVPWGRTFGLSCLLIILLLSLSLSACITNPATSSNAPNPYHLLTPGVLTVGSDTTNPPLEYADPATHTTWGFDVDLITALAQRLGLKVTIVTSKYETLINELSDGRYDAVISGMSITPDRQQQANFIPYLNAGESLLVQAGNPHHITSLASLCGMAVGVQSGTIEQLDVQAASSVCTESGKPAIAITSLANEDPVVQLLAQQKVVATFQDSPVTNYYVKQHPAQFAVGGTLIKADLDGIAVRKGDTALFNALQTALHAMVADGSYHRLIEKWGMTDGAIAKIAGWMLSDAIVKFDAK
ncbi:MAG TPA: ABC transporter substrate-binding protein [Ktedonobacteraceae bacterium]|nr:ABC transporter substrate-binding protein [Ktedonobacteraceae bacterium]